MWVKAGETFEIFQAAVPVNPSTSDWRTVCQMPIVDLPGGARLHPYFFVQTTNDVFRDAGKGIAWNPRLNFGPEPGDNWSGEVLIPANGPGHFGGGNNGVQRHHDPRGPMAWPFDVPEDCPGTWYLKLVVVAASKAAAPEGAIVGDLIIDRVGLNVLVELPDGVTWEPSEPPSPPPPYTPGAVNLDATTYLTRGGDLTGLANGKEISFFAWARKHSDGAHMQILNGAGAVYIRTSSSNRFSMLLYNESSQNILTLEGAADSFLAADGWVPLFGTANLATGETHLYQGDADVEYYVTYSDDVADLTPGDWGIGAMPGGSQPFDGDLGPVIFWDKFIDWSDVNERRKFIDANGDPVDYGTAADDAVILLDGATATYHENQGTGGGFTVQGNGLTDAGAAPGA